MDTSKLLQELNETALSARKGIAVANLKKKNEETDDQKKIRQKAEKIAQVELTEEKLLAIAKKGGMRKIVFMLDRYVSDESKLSFFEKCIFEEIRKLGFTPKLFSELELDSDDHTDYYIGVQWENL